MEDESLDDGAEMKTMRWFSQAEDIVLEISYISDCKISETFLM